MKKSIFLLVVAMLLLVSTDSYAFLKDFENLLKGKVLEKTSELIDQAVNQTFPTSQSKETEEQSPVKENKYQQKNENGQTLFESSFSDNLYKDITPLKPRNDLLQKLRFPLGRSFVDYNEHAVFYVSKKDPNLIYLRSKGLYVSKDGGKTWLRISFVVDKNNAINVPDTIQYQYVKNFYDVNAPGVFYVQVTNGLLKSTDYGKTWRMIPLPLSFQELRIAKISVRWMGDKSVIYTMGSRDHLFYMSTDDGKTWNKIKPADSRYVIQVFNPSNIAIDLFTFCERKTICNFDNNCSIQFHKVDPKSLTLTTHEVKIGNNTSIYNNYGVSIDDGWINYSTKKDIFYILGSGSRGVLSFNIKTKEIKTVFNERIGGNTVIDEGDTILIKTGNTQEARYYSFDGGRSSTYVGGGLVCGIVKDGELICLTKKLYSKNDQVFNIVKITRDKQVIPWSAHAFESPASYLKDMSSYYDSDYNKNERTRWYLMRSSIDKNIFVEKDGIYYGKEMVFKHDKLNRVVKVDHNEHVAIGQNGIVYVTTDPTLRNWTQLNIPYKHELVDVIKEGNSYFFFANDNVYEYKK